MAVVDIKTLDALGFARVLPSTKFAAPSLSDGDLSPQIVAEWERQVEAYFASRETAFSNNILAFSFIMRNCAVWSAEEDFTLEKFLKYLREAFLDKDWEDVILNGSIHRRMEDSERFSAYYHRVSEGNVLLGSSDKALDVVALRAILQNSISRKLALYLEDDLSTGEYSSSFPPILP